ncbi:hypothetical protein RBS60_16180 [Sinomonas sp. ASV486]|uniref:Uncharacterized protein n=1 Tax=Sinomonas puerhi TaxID=3238584 RepID=A0AB39L4F8_9MICC|nr:hypothetical protein [Sinomonas sp. ASV486]MDQ4491739.1 hypothetical protein [Sinomonas sp. ASV486]
METLLPPILILLMVAAVVVFVLRAGARRAKASVEGALAAGPDAAAAAAARLTEAQHRAIYSLIARGLTVQAIAAYREATGSGLVDARNAVILLDRYPQAFRGGAAAAEPSPDAPAHHDAPAHQAPPAPEQPRAVVRQRGSEGGPQEADKPAPAPQPPAQNRPAAPEEAEDEPAAPRPQRFPYRYRAIVSNGRQTLEVASNMLNDEIYNEIKGLAQIGDAEDAAQMLRRHSDITIEDARAFVSLL